MSSEERDLLEAMVQERDAELKHLKELHAKQEATIQSLDSELNRIRIKQEEDAHHYNVTSKQLRLVNEATEHRLTVALQNKVEEEGPIPLQGYASSAKLQSQLAKSLHHISLLQKQISLLKSSSDEIIKSFQSELKDSLEDRYKTELDLLNQLTQLDREKRSIEDNYKKKLDAKNEEMAKLREEMESMKERKSDCNSSWNNIEHYDDDSIAKVSSCDSRDGQCHEYFQEKDSMAHGNQSIQLERNLEIGLMNQLASLSREKDSMEQDLRHELKGRRESIRDLEKSNENHLNSIKELQQLLEEKETHLNELHNTLNNELQAAIQLFMQGRQDALMDLERIAIIQQNTQSSLQSLTQLSTNTSSTLFHTFTALQEQIKASLLTIELKLKTQLNSFKTNDPDELHQLLKNQNISTQSPRNIKEIQEDTINSIRTSERHFMQRIQKLEKQYNTEMRQLQSDIHDKSNTIVSLQRTIEDLEQGSENPQECSPRSRSQKNNEDPTPPAMASPKIIQQLREEVKTVVERIQDKNEVIAKLTMAVEEHKVREGALKTELKRMKKKVKLMENDDFLTDLERSALRC